MCMFIRLMQNYRCLLFYNSTCVKSILVRYICVERVLRFVTTFITIYQNIDEPQPPKYGVVNSFLRKFTHFYVHSL